MRYLKLKERMFLIFFICVTFPLLFNSFYYYRHVNSQLLLKDKENQTGEMNQSEASIREQLLPSYKLLELLGKEKGIMELAAGGQIDAENNQELEDRYSNILSAFSGVEEVRLQANDGKVLFTAMSQEGETLEDFGKLSYLTEKEYEGGYLLRLVSNQKEVFLELSVPMTGRDIYTGSVISAIVNTDFLSELNNRGTSSFMFLLDQKTEVFSAFGEDGKKFYSGTDKELKKYSVVKTEIKLDNTPNTLTIISVRNKEDILKGYGGDKKLVLYILLPITVSVCLIGIYSANFSRRLNNFKVQMHKAATGDFKLSEISGSDEITELYKDLNIMINSLQHLITTVYEEQVQKEKLNSRQKEVEFKMLASQINPHFLYNTLETIRMKARCNGERDIEELVKMLAKIMRRNIQAGDNLVTLKSELELVEYYLKIQQYRFGERISFHINLYCNVEELKIMPLIIQPIVENAFIHGLEAKEGEGEITIAVQITDKLYIIVQDNGIGMNKEKLEEIINSLNDYSRLTRSSIGLNNVNQRIKLLYGDEYGLVIDSEENAGTRIAIHLPKDMS